MGTSVLLACKQSPLAICLGWLMAQAWPQANHMHAAGWTAAVSHKHLLVGILARQHGEQPGPVWKLHNTMSSAPFCTGCQQCHTPGWWG